MRSIKITQVEKNIKNNRQKVNSKLRSERGSIPRVRRTRSRSLDEQHALTEITKASVDRAKQEGKMKMIGKRKMYYDPAE